jgi:DNA-binding GntR family transcriptional regulator
MSMNPSAAPSLKETAYQHIQSKILNRELMVGEAVSELAISKELGISRTPVREAISQLTAEGLLEQIAGRGTVVRRPTRVDIIELYELREALEMYAVTKAAEHPLDAADRAQLEKLLADWMGLVEELEASGERGLNPQRLQRSMALDFQFHLLLLRAAGNGRVMKVVNDTRVLIWIFAIRREGHDAKVLREIHAYHQNILQAVCAGEARRAMELMGEHIRLSCEERLRDFDRWERRSQIEVSYPAQFGMKLDSDATTV